MPERAAIEASGKKVKKNKRKDREKPVRRSGSIGAKIFFAFVLMAVLTFGSTGVGMFGFYKIDREFREVSDERLPEISNTAQISRLVTELVQAVTFIASTRNQAVLDEHTPHVARLLEDLKTRGQEIAATDAAADFMTVVEEFESTISTTIEDVATIIAQQAEISAMRNAVADAKKTTQNEIQFFAQTAQSEITTGESRTVTASRNAIRQLVDVDLKRLELISALQISANRVTSLLAAFMVSKSNPAIILDAADVQTALDDLQTKVDAAKAEDGLLSPDTAAAIDAFLPVLSHQFNNHTRREPGIAVAELEKHAAELSGLLGADVARQKQTTGDTANASASAVVDELTGLVSGEVNQLSFALQQQRRFDSFYSDLLRIGSLDDIAAIEKQGSRLARRTKSLVASGQKISGKLGTIAEEAKRFVDPESGLFALRVSELQSSERLATSLAQAMAGVEKLASTADGLVAGSLEKIDISSSEVAGEIRQSQTGMVGFGVLVLLVAGLVTYFVVFRRLSQPLRQLVDRTTRLADGDHTTPIPESHGKFNEIGQIQDALRVFQTNLQKIEVLAQERMRAEQKAEVEREDMLARLQQSIGEVARSAAAGDTASRVEDLFDHPVLQALADNLNDLVKSIDTGIADVSAMLFDVSQGDLTSRASTNRTGAFSDLNTNANSAAERLSDMIFEIQSAAGAVNRLVADIKANMIDMSDQAKSQSSALAVIAEKVATIAGVVSENASSASEAEALTGSVTTLSASSIETVEKAISAVADIERNANQIGEIVDMINSIAFQTNLLALNAAVESARAGDAGLGFAVVANEVRSLAQRASASAAQIQDVIGKSQDAVQRGVSLVGQTGDALEQITAGVSDLSSKIENISAAVSSQSTDLSDINLGLKEIDGLTTTTAEKSESTARAAADLAKVSTKMEDLISIFELRGDAQDKAAG